jgi:hypothetical protein
MWITFQSLKSNLIIASCILVNLKHKGNYYINFVRFQIDMLQIGILFPLFSVMTMNLGFSDKKNIYI